MNKQIIVSMKDLRYASILCPHCNTRVTLDFAKEFGGESDRDRFKSPHQCPRCHANYDSAIPTALDAMQRVYSNLREHEKAVNFVVEDETPAP